MTTHVETSDLSTAAVELHEVLGTLGVTQQHIGRLFDVDARSIRRWLRGSRRIPRGAAIVIHLLAREVITVAQVEAAVSIPAARMNGGGSSPEPPALRPVEPAPKQSLADPNLTIAEKIWALEPTTCRWPCGDPRHRDFYFCANRAAEGRPYCEHHQGIAYLASPTDSGHGATAPAHAARSARQFVLRTLLHV